jgi:SAM-dependent methyltransferase
MGMEWVRDFYSTTGGWWGSAEARITQRDERRVDLLHRIADTRTRRVLELGCGYGTTACAMAQAGHTVTGVEISDRVRFAEQFVRDTDRLTIINDDFYSVTLPRASDIVTYWNGFGVGSDADQRRLLRRSAADWLQPGGITLIDIFNPFVWAGWDGADDSPRADPRLGYRHDLSQHIEFDPTTSSAIDTWWETADPRRRFTQTLRCYTPADLQILLENSGLQLHGIVVGDGIIDLPREPSRFASLLNDHHEYVAILRNAGELTCPTPDG